MVLTIEFVVYLIQGKDQIPEKDGTQAEKYAPWILLLSNYFSMVI